MAINYFRISILVLVFFLASICAKSQQDAYAGENVPITFYGRVIDQDGNPVPEAKVSCLVIITHFATYSGGRRVMALQTDQNGDFLITGAIGNALDKIAIEKQGYELSKKSQRGFSFGFPHTPPKTSVTDPVVFRMWKISGKMPLIGSSWHGRIARNGDTNRYDLLTGHVSTVGSLEITCSRSPARNPPPAPVLTC